MNKRPLIGLGVVVALLAAGWVAVILIEGDLPPETGSVPRADDRSFVQIGAGGCRPLEASVSGGGALTFGNETQSTQTVQFADTEVGQVIVDPGRQRSVELPGAGEYTFTCAGDVGRVTVTE